jgi:hypothetical protein
MTVWTLRTAPKQLKPAAKRKDLPAVTPHLVCAGAADAIAFYKRRSVPSR